MKKIIIINGPNLNLIGKREPKIYGNSSMEDYLSEIRNNFPEIQIDYFHSNVEGDLINKLQEVGFSYDGVVLNAGGYTHTSIAISDAVAAIQTSVVEVHISNVYKREDYRHQSLMAKNCIGIVAGFGLHSYKMAIDSFL
ncbi:MAG: 3-dehydroquinate dehydratase [Flavobacteriales bacterium]|nr:3-dehydroquinate dehydratase [Flavobacteriales bacterium]MDG1439779.1 3-dehydroquinate dehydratase [Flavobacteriales bacterium]